MKKVLFYISIFIITLSLLAIFKAENSGKRILNNNYTSEISDVTSNMYLDNLKLNYIIKKYRLTYNKLGEGIKIAIIDTGINSSYKGYTNKCFNGNIIHQGYTKSIDRDRVEYKNTGNTAISAHGTEIASIITCPEETKFNIGSKIVNVRGVAPGVKLIVINAFPESGDLSPASLRENILEAYRAGANIINISLAISDNHIGEVEEIRRLEETIDNLYEKKNVLVISSSGNQGPDKVIPPANFKNVLTVGSISTGLSIRNEVNINGKSILGRGGEISWLEKASKGEVYPTNGYLKDGCSGVDNQYYGKIVLIWRGGCSFEDKLNNLKNSGALGGIIVDGNSNLNDFTLSHLSEVKYDFPLVIIRNSDFSLIKEEIKRGVSGVEIGRSIFMKEGGERLNTFSTFSNTGLVKPDIVNYGGGVLSSGFNCLNCGSISDGTSESAAVTSGVLAAFWAQHKDFTASKIKNIIIQTSDNNVRSYLGGGANLRMSGSGVPNLEQAERANLFSNNSYYPTGRSKIIIERVNKNYEINDEIVITYNKKRLKYKILNDKLVIDENFPYPGELKIVDSKGNSSRIYIYNQ